MAGARLPNTEVNDPDAALRRRPAPAGTHRFGACYVDDENAEFVHVRVDDGVGGKSVWWEPRGVEVNRLRLYSPSALPPTAAGPVVVVEGERAAHAIAQCGYPVVATYGESHTPSDAALGDLRGRDVILWPDWSDGGRRHLGSVAQRLVGVATSIRVVNVPADAEDKWDAADASPSKIVALIEAASELEDAARDDSDATEDSQPSRRMRTGGVKHLARQSLAALQFAEAVGDTVRYDHSRRAWHIWNGHRWRPDRDEPYWVSWRLG